MPTHDPATGVPASTLVTAIVVVHQVDDEATTEALGSLVASNDVTLTITVVYNGDRTGWPGLQALCERNHAKAILCERNEGFGAAVNTGLAEVPEGRAVFLLNDDARVDPDAIARCLTALDAAGPQCISVAPMVLHHEQPTRIDSMGVVVRPNGEGFNAYQGRRRDEFAAAAAAGDTIDILGPSFAAALFRPGAFDDAMVGLLSTRYFLYYEDLEWNVRARHRGFCSVATPAAIAYHRHALSTRAIGEAARFRMVQRNRMAMAVATMSWRGVARVASRWVVENTHGAIRGPHRRARLHAAVGALRLVPWALGQRRHHRSDHPAPDGSLFAYAVGHAPAIDTTDYTLTG